MRRLLFICAASICFALTSATAIAQAPAGKKAEPTAGRAGDQQSVPTATAKKVEVQAWVDRTAIWVADRVTYTIELKCQPGVDILAADLTPDKIPLDGLEVIGNDIDRDIGIKDETIYKFRYYLTTYRVDAPTLKIGTMVIRYYVKRAGQSLGDAAPLGEVQVPAASVAFRSLIPDDQQKYTVRDTVPAAARSERYAKLQSIGIGLIVISILPAVLFAAAIARRLWMRARRPSALQVRHDESTSFETVKAMDLTTAAGRREAYAQLNALMREHLSKICGANASALTPVEISGALSAQGTQISEELVNSVLSSCEQALYAPMEAIPTAEACRLTMDKAGRVLAPGR